MDERWRQGGGRRRAVGMVVAAALVWVAPASGRAAPFVRVKVKAVRGAVRTATIAPKQSFIDDPLALNASGSRLAYVRTDGGNLSELVVVDPAHPTQPLARIDLSRFTTAPARIAFAAGDELLVIAGRPARARLLRLDGKVLARFGPADDIRLADRAGHAVVVAYSKKSGAAVRRRHHRHRHHRRGRDGGPAHIRYELAVYALPSGKRIEHAALVTEASGYSRKLDFRLMFWEDAYRRAVGIKGGHYDAASDTHTPDAEGWYDLVAKRFAIHPIQNLLAHAELMRLMRHHSNERRFVVVKHDLSGIEAVDARGGETVKAVALAEPFRHYDPKSLIWHERPDGTLFFTLTIDPVNVDAVAEKKVVPAWIDLYELSPGSAHAVRRARMLRADKRKVMWRVAGGRWVVVPRNIGFDRGGVRVEIYRLGASAPR